MSLAEVETERLLLRPFTMDDVDDHQRAVYGDPDAMKYMPGRAPRTREQTERLVAFFVEHWQQKGFGPWAVLHKADAIMIGECGLNTVTDTSEIEVQYALDKAYWGQGIATEGAKASLRYGFERLKLEQIIALAMPENIASRRVMEKLGMIYQRIAHYYKMDLAYYTISQAAFQPDDSMYLLRE